MKLQTSNASERILLSVLHEANNSCPEHHATKIPAEENENIWSYLRRIKNEGHPMFDFTGKVDRHPITNELLETE